MPNNGISRNIALDLLSEGRAIFEFPTTDLIPGIIRGFERLLAESEKDREQWLFDRSVFQEKRDPDDGLIHRRGEKSPSGDVYDEKFFLHIKRDFPILLKDRGIDMEIWVEWVEKCMMLHEQCILTILNVAAELDEIMPGFQFHDHVASQAAMGTHCLRLLWYSRPRPHDAKNVIGASHVDRDFLTIHIADSRPGLYIPNPADRDNRSAYSAYDAAPDVGLLFPGAKAQRFTAHLPMLPHEIRDTAGANAPPRWSMVFFSHTDTPLAEIAKDSCRLSHMAATAGK